MELHNQPGPHFLQENFEEFFENSLCGYVIMGLTGRVIRGNTRLATWLGYSTDGLKDKSFSDFLSVGGKIYFETHLWPLLHMQGYFDEIALELACKDGTRLPVLVNAYTNHDENKQARFIRLTVFKATDRRLYEQNLIVARAAAETRLSDEQAISALREQFIAVLGHDLRNPLSAIMGGAAILSRSSLNAQDAVIANMIKNSALRMRELIENIMDFARAKLGGGMAVVLKPTALEPVITQVIEETRLAWPGRLINAELDIPPLVNCDAPRVAQLLSNLLANALIYGATNSPVTVRGSTLPQCVELSVSNSGNPIPEGAIERLFQPFTREGSRPSQNGLGLGLYIASEIARGHKGVLLASSTPKETRFSFQIPCQP